MVRAAWSVIQTCLCMSHKNNLIIYQNLTQHCKEIIIMCHAIVQSKCNHMWWKLDCDMLKWMPGNSKINSIMSEVSKKHWLLLFIILNSNLNFGFMGDDFWFIGLHVDHWNMTCFFWLPQQYLITASNILINKSNSYCSVINQCMWLYYLAFMVNVQVITVFPFHWFSQIIDLANWS